MAPAVRWTLLLFTLLYGSACHRSTPAQPTTKPHQETLASNEASPAKSTLPDFAVDAVATHEGEAFWYDVPDQSLPQRRAWAGELTAASDALPLNSYARVRRLDSGQTDKEVIVRITDTGIQHKGGIIDLNRAAADALDLIRIGKARVRVETLALKNASTDKPVERKGEPVTPKASEINGQPAADQQAEKAAAEAKTGGKKRAVSCQPISFPPSRVQPRRDAARP